MAHFAKLGVNGKVIAVHVLDNNKLLNADNVEDESVGQQELQRIHGWPADMWIKTSYNGTMRKNFASVGYTYDLVRDAFIAPEPENATGFDEETCQWIVPEVDREADTL